MLAQRFIVMVVVNKTQVRSQVMIETSLSG